MRTQRVAVRHFVYGSEHFIEGEKIGGTSNEPQVVENTQERTQ
jgi:hypothetical protein